MNSTLKYPNEFHIGDAVYTLKFVKQFEDEGTVGECDPGLKEIRIKRGLGKKETLKTLIHELCHAIFEYENDIKMKHKKIYEIETPIYEFIRDNF